MVNGITAINSEVPINYSDIMALNSGISSNDDESIFASAYGSEENVNSDKNVEELYAQLSEVEDKQGAIMNAWNGVKEFTNIGTSVEKCDEAIEKYKNGEITFEEAAAEIDNFDAKQDSSLNLFSNIATSFTALAAGAAVVATGGAAAPVVAGALAGAATKVTVKAADRATNDVEGDTLDAKQIAKDALSGALTGGTAVATAGTGANTFKNGMHVGTKTLEGAKACAIKSAKTGVITGTISGAANYSIDCAFDEDKDFSAKELAKTTGTSAVVGGTVGLIMGGTNGVLRSNHILQAADDNVLVNATSSAGYKITNDRIRAIA